MFMYMSLYLLRFKVWGCGLQCWVPDPAVAPPRTLQKQSLFLLLWLCVVCDYRVSCGLCISQWEEKCLLDT